MGAKSEKIIKDLQFVHHNKETANILTKCLKGCIKILKDL